MRIFLALMLAVTALSGAASAAPPPNVLFISVDDLNDWISPLGGHPQTKTPNFERLAKMSVLFTNAYCAAPSCNPSRTAIFSGLPPHRSGLYANAQKLREVLPDAELLPKYFSRHGYWSAGAGKLLHYIIDPPSWDDYFPDKNTNRPLPFTVYPKKRPVNLPVGGPWQYVETDWAPLDVTDEEFGGDWSVTQWIGGQLQRDSSQPFFLACGLYRPHEPWFVPKKYFEPFPLESIQVGPGYRENDLDDVPPRGQAIARNRYFEHIRKNHQWKQAVQAYLASIHFADAMLGRVLDAVERSPQRDNTIIVLWSDHGWHLGEKEHWQKYTGWRIGDRVPLMIRVPRGAPGLTAGTTAGEVCERPVSLVDLYHTLTELCGLPPKPGISARSLVPLLRDPKSNWPHAAITQLSAPDEFAVSTQDWRYLHYRDGGEELYNIITDPHEWTNLAGKPEHAAKLAELRSLAPVGAVPVPAIRVESLPALAWQPITGNPVPPSKPDGNTFDVVFINRTGSPVELCWMDPAGAIKSHGLIAPRAQRREPTRPGSVWMVRDDKNQPLGYFAVGDRSARAEIPEGKRAE